MDVYDHAEESELRQQLDHLLRSVVNRKPTVEVVDLAAPQGFEPRYADPESAVLPLNEGAASEELQAALLILGGHNGQVNRAVHLAAINQLKHVWRKLT